MTKIEQKWFPMLVQFIEHGDVTRRTSVLSS